MNNQTMKWLTVLALILTVSTVGAANDLTTPFPDTEKLDVMTIRGTLDMPVTIYFDSSLAQSLNQKHFSDSEIYEESGIFAVRALRTRLSQDSAEEYFIDFEEGGSFDPTFHISSTSSHDRREIGYIFGTTLVIPGDGYVYVAGHTNNMFDQRKKLKISDGRLTEVEQPFYFVGLKTMTKTELVLYSSPTPPAKVVATLPQGSEITVLLNHGDDYLGATSFGLTGWFSAPSEQTATLVEGLFFRGD